MILKEGGESFQRSAFSFQLLKIKTRANPETWFEINIMPSIRYFYLLADSR
jgi:hypothetical protein